MELQIYCDGSGSGDFCYFVVDNGSVVKVFHEDNITHNEAEYKAVIEALEYAYERFKNVELAEADSIIEILSDSMLVINQLSHEWNIKQEHLRKLALRAWHLQTFLLNKLFEVKFTWVPRHQNLAGKILG